MTNLLARHGVPNEWINEIRGLATNYYFPFFEWAIGMAQMGEGNFGDHGHLTYNINDFLFETGDAHRWCGGCSGDIGSCNSICTSIEADTNIDQDNWNNPGDWKLKSGKITFYFPVPW